MIAAPIPDNEQERLADLRALKLLDTPPEERFDRIVALAADVFDAPIAYIALVDNDRQWFKAKCGLTADQTDRQVSFCGHAILHNEPLIVPDATRDERFHDNPLVVNDPFIRFYAGYPLAGPGGQNVGTLCVADRKPRPADSFQLRTFKHLAAIAEHELNLFDLITAQRELIDTKTHLLDARDALRRELDEAAAYVHSLLPRPMNQNGVRIGWCFEASSELGGDIFGYHWLDDDHLAIYLVDVMGHGVGAALLASSVQAALRRQTLPRTSFDEPGAVLFALNRAFPMAQHDNRFFTAWYGVLNRRTGKLKYSGAGHPPAIVLDAAGHDRLLESTGPIIGLDESAATGTATVDITPGSRVYLFTDGAFELRVAGKDRLGLEGLRRLIAGTRGDSRADEIRRELRTLQGSDRFEDDFSLIEIIVS